MQSKIYMLVESGNVDMAAFMVKVQLKNGGFGFSPYHLLGLILDFDPKQFVKKTNSTKSKEGQTKTPSCGKESSVHRKQKHRKAAHKPIPFDQPFLSKQKQIELLQKIRKHDIIKKTLDNLSITPLHCACVNPNSKTLEYFLNVTDDIYINDLELRKPVHYAACSTTPENLRILFKRGVKLRETDKIQKTPLMYACQYNRIENVKFILENSDNNLNQKSRNARGPVHFAAEHGHLGKIVFYYKTILWYNHNHKNFSSIYTRKEQIWESLVPADNRF